MSEAEYGDRRHGKMRAQFGIWCSEDPVKRMEEHEARLRKAKEDKKDEKDSPHLKSRYP